MRKKSDEINMCDVWNNMIPPSDGKIYVNALGTVCMNYDTFCQICDGGIEQNDSRADFRDWLKVWWWKWQGK